MKARHGITPIPLPAIQTSPTGIGRLSRETRKALAALRDRKIIVSPPPGLRRSMKLPLDVYGLTKDESTFTVFVRPGFVIERTVINDTGTDCLTYHEPEGITVPPEEDPPLDPPPFPGQDPGDAIAHTVANNQSVFVKVTVQDDGTISAAEIEVAASDTESTHYAPPVGDETAGSVGEYYYKLAEFTTDGDTLAIKKFHAGANIDHFQELPRFVKAGGTADIFKTFDQEAGQYKTRGITGIDGIEVTQGADEITIGFTDGEDLHLQVVIVNLSIDFTGETFSFGSVTTESHYWLKGIYVGQTEPTDEDFDPIFQRVTHIANTNANP
jgi:hypothetical protein